MLQVHTIFIAIQIKTPNTPQGKTFLNHSNQHFRRAQTTSPLWLHLSAFINMHTHGWRAVWLLLLLLLIPAVVFYLELQRVSGMEMTDEESFGVFLTKSTSTSHTGRFQGGGFDIGNPIVLVYSLVVHFSFNQCYLFLSFFNKTPKTLFVFGSGSDDHVMEENISSSEKWANVIMTPKTTVVTYS